MKHLNISIFVITLFMSVTSFANNCIEKYCSKNFNHDEISSFLYQRADSLGLKNHQIEVGGQKMDSLIWVSEKIPTIFCKNKIVLGSVTNPLSGNYEVKRTQSLLEESRLSVLHSVSDYNGHNNKNRLCKRYKLVKIGYKDAEAAQSSDYQDEPTYVEP